MPDDAEAYLADPHTGAQRVVEPVVAGGDPTVPAPAAEPDPGSDVGTQLPAVAAVRAAEARLRNLDPSGTPAATHVSTYEEVHAVLQDALADLDER